MDNQVVTAAAVTAGAIFGAISLIKAFSKDEKIRVISNQADCRRGLKEIWEHCRDYPVIGFDCEWTNMGNQRQPVVLLQLQSYHGLCLLIRLPYVGILEELQELLENERILKVGVGVDLDAKYLFEDYRVHVRSTLDLRYMAVLAKCEPGKLIKMSEDCLKFKLCKEYAYSDWDASNLSEKAIEYAAKDVHAAIELFKYFEERIYDGWMLRTSRERVKYVIDRFCSKFLNLYYNGAQGVPHALIRQRLSN
ncbi:exonuclease 3'-5' domain-containing protein 2-like [Contarinia nasturtii]|uniref:exonuclease 3'-5' domain-containing protein 2-like n=1 Tax=Contarinia nasturtii TaxID=265458 RepID=UPI0012D3EDA9|nr:exonuclease 3'-5' domain-containing protein 2-like [Contarinia nasturtii]